MVVGISFHSIFLEELWIIFRADIINSARRLEQVVVWIAAQLAITLRVRLNRVRAIIYTDDLLENRLQYTCNDLWRSDVCGQKHDWYAIIHRFVVCGGWACSHIRTHIRLAEYLIKISNFFGHCSKIFRIIRKHMSESKK